MHDRQMALEAKKRENASKPQKSKEELAALRRDMMKKKPSQKEPEPVPEHPKAALMSRLAQGTKVGTIEKKDMLKLTNKNYELLPEVKKKREQEAKREEIIKRKEQVKLLEKQRREKMLKK